ncbi:hypothetical protein CKAN_01265300 [Cinnamomum micranthum f. kanehirae]|uniref:SPARK domain-containing protein n=1 Tax=Cinnamomum micranthum f. kanehirae TaxID=337451 RepID=A0A3S3MHJ0_9MAGN|nr:hypothetical protein CKAN_01265300 [Cinnamomum micranthum f. kanehirae]
MESLDEKNQAIGCKQFYEEEEGASSVGRVQFKTPPPPDSGTCNTFVLSDPPVGLFDPIQISPVVVPHFPYPETLPPMYPSFPTTHELISTGKCPANFSDIQGNEGIIDKTATDCARPFAALVGNVLCCPRVSSLLHIFQGYYSTASDVLVLHKAAANDCFSDIIIKDVATFEKTADTSKLLEACSSVDPLKVCCRPVCQPAIVETALHISGVASSFVATANLIRKPTEMEVLSD